jgi:hypothetical protein
MKADDMGAYPILVGIAFHRVPDLPKAHKMEE